MHIVMLRFHGELTSQTLVDIEETVSIPTNSGGDQTSEVARRRNIDELASEESSDNQARQQAISD
jgi:hypothetical protein